MQPYSLDVESASADIQLELIDLQADISLKESFKEINLIQFYASLSEDKFGHLKRFARKMCVFFASTYICEQTFSCMNFNKSKNRSSLTDTNLHAILRTATSIMTPEYTKLTD